MRTSVPGRLVGLVVSGALLLATPVRVHAGEGDVTPESASNARFGVEQQGKVLSDRGDFQEAAALYWREGVQLKDPVLILDSAEALRDQAAAERSIDVARSAIDRAAPAMDMLYYLRDGATSSAWQPVAPEYVSTVITRGEALITDVEALIAAIEDEQRKAAEGTTEAEPTKPKRERGPAKPGTVLIAAGGAAVAVGLGGAGLGVAGLALGARAQSEVEDPLVYEPEHSAAAQRGKSANVLAGVGLAIAGVGVGAGVALIVLGLKKRKAGGGAATEAMLVPMFDQRGAGLGLVGRF